MKSEGITQCRLCGQRLELSPVLTLSPFPRAAQYYPEPAEFAEDRGIELRVYRCLSCDLLQLASSPVPYFKDVITAASLSGDAKAARQREFGTFCRQFDLGGKSVIEIGCGKGGMVEVLAAAGMAAVGLEASVESVKEARAGGRNVIEGYLPELGLEHEGKYAAFVSLNYIEHQPDTRDFIRGLARITQEGAVGYVTAPNVEHLLQHNILYEFVADHLVYFTATTMRRAFEISGFDVLDSQFINNANDIALTVRKRQYVSISGVRDVERLVKELRELITELNKVGRKVAVWGAGHRTLALLTLASCEGLECIIDSAPFKHGKFSTVTHLKIISPAEFEASGIDTVIVAVPGIYPDEVVNRLKQLKPTCLLYKLVNNQINKIAES